LKIFGVGEVLYDVSFVKGSAVGGHVGGSVLNALSTLASMGHNVHLVSEVGEDLLGQLIEKEILEKKIDCYLFKDLDKKTSLALAFLDERGDADYSFYKSHWAPSLKQTLKLDFQIGDVFLYGSLFSIHENSHDWLLQEMKSSGFECMNKIFDPNLRKGYLRDIDLKTLESRVVKCMSLANLVKASTDDMELLWGEMPHAVYYEKIKKYCPYLVLTQGSEGLKFFSPDFRLDLEAKACKDVVSTIGAGDNLNAGLVSGFAEVGKSCFTELNKAEWMQILGRGIEFGSAVCAVKAVSLEPKDLRDD
jgi:fructokinase